MAGGAGYVRWADETNRGFLRCSRGLQQMASPSVADEAERIACSCSNSIQTAFCRRLTARDTAR
jgi:hypothetical protein